MSGLPVKIFHPKPGVLKMWVNEIYTSSDCVNYYQIYDINELIMNLLNKPESSVSLRLHPPGSVLSGEADV